MTLMQPKAELINTDYHRFFPFILRVDLLEHSFETISEALCSIRSDCVSHRQKEYLAELIVTV